MKEKYEANPEPKLLKDLGRVEFGTQGNKVRKGIYECPICEQPYEANTPNINSGRSTKCRSCASKTTCLKHGETNTRIYKTWLGMKDRCYNPNHKNYEHYGDRGIKVFDEWKDYETFRDWCLANGYSDDLTIDRIDVDGNYEPHNCRFANANTQAQNTRMRKDNTSGYRGVKKSGDKWQGRITADKKNIHLGTFNTAIEASRAFDKYVIDNNLEHNVNGV